MSDLIYESIAFPPMKRQKKRTKGYTSDVGQSVQSVRRKSTLLARRHKKVDLPRRSREYILLYYLWLLFLNHPLEFLAHVELPTIKQVRDQQQRSKHPIRDRRHVIARNGSMEDVQAGQQHIYMFRALATGKEHSHYIVIYYSLIYNCSLQS